MVEISESFRSAKGAVSQGFSIIIPSAQITSHFHGKPSTGLHGDLPEKIPEF
jgi:hypothetical protein